MLSRLVNSVLDFFRSLFWKQEMELTLVGLQNSGKTTLVNVIAVSNFLNNLKKRKKFPSCILILGLKSGQFSEGTIPTVGFNMKKVTKGNVTIKLWDIGGQPRFRSMWERYCRGVNAIVYEFFEYFFNLICNEIKFLLFLFIKFSQICC